MALAAALVFTSCHKPAGKQTKYIPKDAYMVFSLNTKSVVDKINKGGYSVDSLISMFADNKDSAKKAIDKYQELKNAGIDFDQPATGYFKMGGSIMAGQSVAAAGIVSLKSTSDFEAFLKKENPGKDIKKGTNFSYMVLDNSSVAGWNDDVAIFAGKSNTSPRGTDGIDNIPSATGSARAQETLTAMFGLKESESINSVKGFDEMAKKAADLSFFINSEGMPANPMISMSKISDLLKGSYAIGTADFEDGKMAVSFTSHPSQAMADLLKKYPSRAIDLGMVDKYPGNVQAFMVGAIDPGLIPAVIQYLGFDAVANQYLQQGGLTITIADIFKAFKGDFAIVGGDFGTEKKTITEMGGYKLPEPTTTEVPTYKLITNFTIDKTNYNKVAAALAEKGLLVQQNGQYVVPGMAAGGFTMSAADNNLYIASAADVLQQYTAGTGKNNLPGEVHDKIKGKTFALYIDINGLISVVPGDNASKQASSDNAKATFKYILAVGDRGDSKETTANLDFVMVNSKENSLVSLIRYLHAQSKIEKANRPSIDMGGDAPDSTAVMPPMPDTTK